MNIICDSSDQMQIGHHSWLVGSCHIHQIPGVSARFLPPLRSMFREPPLAMTKPYFWPIFAGPGTSDENPDYPDLKRTKFFLRQTCWKAEMGNFGFGSRHIRSDLKQAFNRKF